VFSPKRGAVLPLERKSSAATARFGVSIVSTEAENDIAAHAVLDTLSATYADHDAAILAISFDTALAGARQILPIPVIGMTEAALHTACLVGRRFGLISFGTRSRWLYLDLVRRSGLLERMVAFEAIELTTTENYLREGAQDQLVCEAPSGWSRPEPRRWSSRLRVGTAIDRSMTFRLSRRLLDRRPWQEARIPSRRHAPGVLAVVWLDNPRDNARVRSYGLSLPSLGSREE
jgi:hypothetical protein